VEEAIDSGEAIEPSQTAKAADLYYVGEDISGFKRGRSDKGFTYRGANGERVTDRLHLGRIRSLVVPPAWTDVWICTNPHGHIQATGRDARGRK